MLFCLSVTLFLQTPLIRSGKQFHHVSFILYFMADKSQVRGDAIIMLFSAAIFAYFGFTLSNISYPPVLFAIMIWSLRFGAIAFGISGLLALAGTPFAVWLYSISAVLTSLAFIVVGIWHVVDPAIRQNALFTGLIFLAFGLFNGQGAWRSLVARPRSNDSPYDPVDGN